MYSLPSLIFSGKTRLRYVLLDFDIRARTAASAPLSLTTFIPLVTEGVPVDPTPITTRPWPRFHDTISSGPARYKSS